MANEIWIDEKQFVALKDTDAKLNILYTSIRKTYRCHEGRIKKLEKKKLTDTTYAFLGGIIGGIAAIISKWLSGG